MRFLCTWAGVLLLSPMAREARLGQSDLSDTITDFDKTLEIEPPNEAAFKNRGQAEMRQNSPATPWAPGKPNQQAATANDPDSPLTIEAHRHLKKLSP
jgi:hypothetical protein